MDTSLDGRADVASVGVTKGRNCAMSAPFPCLRSVPVIADIRKLQLPSKSLRVISWDGDTINGNTSVLRARRSHWPTPSVSTAPRRGHRPSYSTVIFRAEPSIARHDARYIAIRLPPPKFAGHALLAPLAQHHKHPWLRHVDLGTRVL